MVSSLGDVVDSPVSCHHRRPVDTFALSREIRRLPSKFVSHGGVDPLRLFSRFLRNWFVSLLLLEFSVDFS